MRKLLGQFIITWLVLIFTLITGAILMLFIEHFGGIMILFPLMMLALFVLNEVKDYTEKSRKDHP